MLAALLLAAGAAFRARPKSRATSIDQRVSLMEARQMLQSQTLWTLQAAVPPPDVAKAMGDLDLHLQQDRERDEKMEKLESDRLAARAAAAGDRAGAGRSVHGRRRRAGPASRRRLRRVSPMMVLRVKPQAQAKVAKKKHGKAQAAATVSGRCEAKSRPDRPHAARSSPDRALSTLTASPHPAPW